MCYIYKASQVDGPRERVAIIPADNTGPEVPASPHFCDFVTSQCHVFLLVFVLRIELWMRSDATDAGSGLASKQFVMSQMPVGPPLKRCGLPVLHQTINLFSTNGEIFQHPVSMLLNYRGRCDVSCNACWVQKQAKNQLRHQDKAAKESGESTQPRTAVREIVGEKNNN